MPLELESGILNIQMYKILRAALTCFRGSYFKEEHLSAADYSNFINTNSLLCRK